MKPQQRGTQSAGQHSIGLLARGLTLLTLLGLLCPPTRAQTPLWATSAGGPSNDDLGLGIAVDGSGNAYVTGTFEDTMTIGTTMLTSDGFNDIFVAKYDASGRPLWATSAGSSDDDDGAAGIAVDESGNAYVTGSFGGTMTIGTTTLTSNGGDDIFVAKYDASGKPLWAMSAGGSDYGVGIGIAVDGSGNVYVTGYFVGTLTIGTTMLTSDGLEDIFVAKYDASGSPLWATSAGGSDHGYVDESGAAGIAVDGNGNAYVTGVFEDTMAIGTTTLTSNGGDDIFVAKYDASGKPLWAMSAGGSDDDEGVRIAVDGDGNACVTGSFGGTMTVGTTTLTSNGGDDIFVAKYDASGSPLWATSAGGNAYGIAVDGNGNAYVTGSFGGTMTIGTTTLTSDGDADIFVAKYDASGSPLWATSAGGAEEDVGVCIVVDGGGNAYVTGYFEGTMTIGTTTLTSNGYEDIFVAKYAGGSTTDTGDGAETPAAYVLEANYPNPFNPTTTLRFALPRAAAVRLAVYDLQGHQVAVLVEGDLAPGWHEVVWDGRATSGRVVASGSYLVRLEAGGVPIEARRMILLK